MHTYKYRKSIMVQWINAGGTETKTEKTAFQRCQCFAPAVSAVACLISIKPHKTTNQRDGSFVYAKGIPKEPSLWFVVRGSGLNQPHHITNADLSSEVGGIAKRIKTARLRRKNQTRQGRDTSRPPIMWYYIEYQPFGADAKYRVPTMQNRLGDLTQSP